MKSKTKKPHKTWKTPTKWAIFGLLMGVVLATVGSVAALNGWFGGGSSIPEDTMTRGLVGYWGFEEGSGTTAHDASNYSNNGTLTWMATDTDAWTKGKVGGALSFDGTDDYILFSDTFVFHQATDATVEFWVKPQMQGAEMEIFWGRADGTDTNRFTIFVDVASETIYINYLSPTGVYHGLAGTIPSPANVWTHITITRIGNTYYGYSNGVYISQATDASPDLPNSVGWQLSGRPTPFRYKGTIDEVRIYNRALSAEEVRFHYNRGGPVAQWKFDEGEGRTAYDSTDNNNDGTLILAGSATSSAWVSGKYGSALSFDGVDDYVSMPTVSITGTNDFTIGTWVKYNRSTSGLHVYKLGTASTNNAVGLFIPSEGSTALEFGFHAGDAMNKSGLNDGVWHYVVGTGKNGNSMSMYVDGVAVQENKATTYNLGSTFQYIGKHQSGGYWDGLIDDVRIYNYARTPDEIRLDYNAGFAALFGPKSDCNRDPGACMTQGLVGSWDFEEGSGTTAHDASNYANTGTLTAGPSWTKGKVGGALSFDGSDDYVQIPNLGTLIGGNVLSVEAWVKQKTTSQWDYLFFFGDTLWAGFGCHFANTVGEIYIGYMPGGVERRIHITIPNYSLNTWHHLVYTHNGVTQYLYVDGVYVGEKAAAENHNWGSLPYYIGGSSVDNQWLDGLIDEVRIYNRALTAEEVRYHYNRGGPVAQWKFDEGEGRTAYDSTDNNNDGTLVLAGSATSSAWVAGKYGSALSFDGVDDYVNAGDILDSLSNMSYGFWAKRTTKTGVQYPISKGYTNFALVFDAGADTGSVYFANGAGGYTPIAFNPGVDTTTWNYYTVTKSGATASFYVNGIQIFSGIYTIPVTLPNTAYNLNIGRDSQDVANYFNGLIDDVRIYNYARTPDEIRLDYNAGFAAHFGESAVSCSASPSNCMTQGLVGSWDFEEGSGTTAHDASNYSNNGTLTWMATDTDAWTKGKVGGALSFDGTDDYVSVGNTKPTTYITVEVWVKPGSTQKQYADILGNHGVVGMDGYAIQQNSNNLNQYYFTYGNGSTWEAYSLVTQLNTNEWNHFVVQKDDTTVRHYLNGNLAGTVSVSGDIAYAATHPIWIGLGNPSDRYFNGLIDEVRIYNRALSTEEVRYHYNKGGPVAQWKFDEGEGRTAYDSTENNNDGTLVLAGSATSSAWVQGKYGSALSFDGTDDYVSAGNGASLQITGALTIESWIKANSFTDNRGVIQKYDAGGSQRGYTIYIANGVVQWVISSTLTPYTGAVRVSATTLTTGNWYHIVTVFSPSANQDIYINGVLDNGALTGAIQASIANPSRNLAIGANYNNSTTPNTDFFNGLIDDVRIYNYARTPLQIQQDYNAGLSAHFK